MSKEPLAIRSTKDVDPQTLPARIAEGKINVPRSSGHYLGLKPHSENAVPKTHVDVNAIPMVRFSSLGENALVMS